MTEIEMLKQEIVEKQEWIDFMRGQQKAIMSDYNSLKCAAWEENDRKFMEGYYLGYLQAKNDCLEDGRTLNEMNFAVKCVYDWSKEKERKRETPRIKYYEQEVENVSV